MKDLKTLQQLEGERAKEAELLDEIRRKEQENPRKEKNSRV